jgi:RimJ/RimL family protein N-acetyltransferase
MVYQAVSQSLESLRQFPESLAWAIQQPSVEQSELYCRRAQTDFAARIDFPLLMTLRETGTMVGSSGLHRPDWSVPKFELGFWGHSAFLGRGLITEGVRAILEFAFLSLGARRIEALPDNLNHRSCALCERAGMTLEGLMRHERAAPNGTLRDTRMYAAIR